MNKLVVSESISKMIEANPSIQTNKLRKNLHKQGISVSTTLIEELKSASNYDRELLEIEIMKKSMNINY